MAGAVVLTSCTEHQNIEPLAQASLNAAQTEALRRMNEAGTTAYAGQTWRYQFGAACVLRIRRTFEGRADRPQDHAMAQRTIEIVSYPDGFGVKAYGIAKGGSVDLFDTTSTAQAKSFAHFADDLIRPCASPTAR